MLRQIARGAPGTLWRRVYNVPDPAAGADVIFPVPPHRAWLVLAVACTLHTSAAAGRRAPTLVMRDTGGTPLAAVLNISAGAGTEVDVVTWAAGLGISDGQNTLFIQAALPYPWYMMPQESLQITGQTDAGDQWSNVRITVIETNTGDPDYIGAEVRSIKDHVEALHEYFR